MNPTRPAILLLATLFSIIAACGGGGGGLAGLSASQPVGGGGSGGIGGTGLTTSGTIDGTGSILVNGIRFDVSGADIRIDGEPATEADLGPGMIVTVQGSLGEDDPDAGTADEVDYERDLVGPVDSIELSSDNNSMRLRIFDRSVIAERVNTVFSGLGFDTIALNDVVEVSGFTDEQNRIRATRIALDPGFVPNQSEIRLQGTVSGLMGTMFQVGDRTVRADNAVLVNLPGDALANGQQVEVTGTLNGNIINASRITLTGSLADNLQSGDPLVVQGTITDFVSPGNFRVRDIPVNAGEASLELAGDSLRNGLVAEIEGSWNGSLLDANLVKARRGRIRAEARLNDIDSEAGTLTLAFMTGSVTVTTDARTLLTDDDVDEGFFSIDALRAGDFVSTEALLDGNTLLATRVRRDDEGDEDVLQAPVERFTSGVNVTLLGITFETAGAEFETIEELQLDSPTFYDNLAVGDLVRVKDDDPADGIADKVEFASAINLDGDIEFPEDDFDDDSDGDPDDLEDDSQDDDATDDLDGDGPDDDATDDLEDDSPDDEANDDLEDDSPDDDATDDLEDDGPDDDANDDLEDDSQDDDSNDDLEDDSQDDDATDDLEDDSPDDDANDDPEDDSPDDDANDDLEDVSQDDDATDDLEDDSPDDASNDDLEHDSPDDDATDDLEDDSQDDDATDDLEDDSQDGDANDDLDGDGPDDDVNDDLEDDSPDDDSSDD